MRDEIQALLDATPNGKIGIHQAGRPVVSIPYGEHVLDGPIVINRRMDVSFCGGVLIVPDGVRAIEMKSGAWGARVRDVCVFGQSQDGAAHGTDGILVEAYGAEVRDAFIRFVGIGIHIAGSQTKNTNANGFAVSDVSIFNCDIGLHIKGGDTNAGQFVGVKIDSCRSGILDESFLGNVFVSTMLHTISEHAYKCTVGANYSTFIGTYMELDCGSALPNGIHGTIVDKWRQSWIGGAAVTYCKVADRLGYGSTRLRFGETASDGVRYTVRIPDAAVEAVFTAERRDNVNGGLIDGWRARWVSLLKQCGFEVYKPNAPSTPLTGDGLTRPLGWTTEGHPDGFGHARHDAEHFSAGNPQGYPIAKSEE